MLKRGMQKEEFAETLKNTKRQNNLWPCKMLGDAQKIRERKLVRYLMNPATFFRWRMNGVKVLQCLFFDIQQISIKEAAISDSPEIIKTVLGGIAEIING